MFLATRWQAASARKVILGLWVAIVSLATAEPRIPAKITLLVLDPYGTPLDYKIESFRDASSGVELAGQFKGGILDKVLLTRTYICRVSPQPPEKQLMRIERTIKINNEDMVVTLVAEDGALPSLVGAPRTNFRIRPSPVIDDQLTWASVRPAFGPGPAFIKEEPETTVIRRDGTFSLIGIHGGRYLVTIFRAGKILKLVSLVIPLIGPNTPLEIPLE
jgi:hypothetical protein